MKNAKIRFCLIIVLLATSLGCSITDLVGDQIKDLVEDQIPDADEIQGLIEDIPGDVEELIPADIDELIPQDVDEQIPEDIDELVPEDIDELIPEDIDELIPEDVEEAIEENLDQFTEDVPLPENATNKEEFNGIITFESPDDPDQVAEFYRQKLPEEGWNITNDQDLGLLVMMSAEKGENSVEIVINSGLSSGSTVLITSTFP